MGLSRFQNPQFLEIRGVVNREISHLNSLAFLLARPSAARWLAATTSAIAFSEVNVDALQAASIRDAISNARNRVRALSPARE